MGSNDDLRGRSASWPWVIMLMLKELTRSLAYYLLTGLCVSGLAFVDHYPMVYSDSGTYIANAYSLVQNDDRPIAYGHILRAVGWQGTLWTMVLFQGARASWLLMLLCRETVTGPQRWVRTHLLLLTGLILCSSLPWYSAQIMADHFTPLVLIVVFLLFHARSLGKWRQAALWVVLFFLLATHNAHFIMAAVLGGMLLLHTLRQGSPGLRAFWWRWAGLNITIVGSALMIMCFNLVDHGHSRLSNASNVFLAGRLCEGGIMADYLDETCPSENNPLCDLRSDLPVDAGHMLWSANGLPSKRGITIGQADSLLAPVVHDVLSRPEYLIRYIRSAFVSSAVQLFQWEVGTGLDAYREDSAPFYVISHRLPEELYSYNTSRQQQGFWEDRDDINRRIAVVLVLSLLVLAIDRLNKGTGRHPLTTPLVSMIMAWVVLNAAVTSAFSVIDPRLQSRVLWLLTMAAFLILVEQPSIRGFLQLGETIRRMAPEQPHRIGR